MTGKFNYFCTTEQLKPHLTEDLQTRSEADWIKASLQGDFIPIFRFGGGVYWRKSAFLKWSERRFGIVRPDLIQNLKEAGFVPAE